MRDVIGQRRLLDRIGAQALRGGVAHAYGLFGPRSIGKRTVARRLAQTLNCEAADRGAGGCGRCTPCQRIERGIHPDVFVVERAEDRKDITIEQVRSMRQNLALRPLEGRTRVVIVDDAAELNQYGQDALLKTLEEPPAHAVLLVLTTTPAALHETIASRLQPLPFRLVPTAEIAAALAERFGRPAAGHAAAAAGRPGLAITLAGDETARRERAALEAEFFGLVSKRLTDRFAWAADLADDADARRRAESIESRFDAWSELLRDAALASSGLGHRPLRPERAELTGRLAAAVRARDLVDAALLVDKLRRDLAFNANTRSMLELLALRLPYNAAVAA